MATIFINVEADIALDLANRFPQDFDFDAMLRKVCEDAGVVVEGRTEMEGLELKTYRLKGLWLPMEKAYKHLVTTLALYGSRLPGLQEENKLLSTLAEDYEDKLNMGDLYNTTSLTVKQLMQDLGKSDSSTNDFPIDATIPHSSDKTSGSIASNDTTGQTLPVSTATPAGPTTTERRQRRPRKSTQQNRKLEEAVESIESEGEEDLMGQTEEEGAQHEEKENEENESGKKKENKEESPTALKKRGRPRKGAPVRVVTRKKRGPYKNRVLTVNVDSGDAQTIRKRGRPKLYSNGNNTRTEWPCKECSFVATKRSMLRSHRLRLHLCAPTKCDICQKVFPNKRYMLRHRTSHVAPQHCCDICGKMYKIRNSMIEHRKTHESGFEKSRVKCDLCPKSFCNRYVLECHVRDIHMGLKKSFLCSVCGKSFTSRHSLKEHSDAHIGVKPHICDVCGKSFSYESALRDHKYTHTESKAFWCSHCQKGFTQRSGLKMHMRIHKQNKLFTCSECGRGFTQKQALQRHERVHKGEKPFICKQCGRFFTDASIIRRHLILVHKIHKDAATWREDIICTVKPQNENHVQKLGEEQTTMSAAEKVKEEILKVVGPHPRPLRKGPSKAFSRTYPRRVALLDEHGNVIAPPEVQQQRTILHKTSDSDTSDTCTKPSTTKAKSSVNQSVTTILASDVSSEMDSSTRYIETQWDALTGPIRPATHIEHIILEDTDHQSMERALIEPGLHKIIKYESMTPMPGLAGGTQQTSPVDSPITFATQSSLPGHTSLVEAPLDSLTPQAAHTGNQFYDNRTGTGAQWSSMFYYSQLASQFGMSINPDYPYVSSSAPAPSTHLANYGNTPNDSSPALILQTTALPSSPARVELQEDSSHSIPPLTSGHKDPRHIHTTLKVGPDLMLPDELSSVVDGQSNRRPISDLDIGSVSSAGQRYSPT